MIIKHRNGLLVALVAASMALSACIPEEENNSSALSDSIAPNWGAIDSWPQQVSDSPVEPSPDRSTTVVVLDDSGSMGNAMAAAKEVVINAIKSFPDDDRVAVIGLNSGYILPPTSGREARATIDAAMKPVRADGGTPLGQAITQAYAIISTEAANQRGFGAYRIISTTDGEESDTRTLNAITKEVLTSSPVQLSTIGIGIGKGHPLNMPGKTTYVAIDNVSQLSDALKRVSAEQASFDPITNFTGGQ